MTELSVVIPVYNERDCLAELYRRLTTVMRSIGRDYEIIFVDDGSDDGSIALIKELTRHDPRTRFLSFTRNFGQSAAITAGQVASRGLGVIVLDADLQNPPEEIPRLLAKFDEGYEVVYGIRQDRQDSWLRRACSAIVGRLLSYAMGVSLRPSVTAFLIAHRRIVDELNCCPERTRFHPALCAWLGARVAYVNVRHDARHGGESKYSYWGLMKRALDLFTGFTQAPLRVAIWSGLVAALFGFGMASWAIMGRLLYGNTLLGWASLMGAIGLLGGMQLLTIGALGEYLGRAYMQILGRPLYVIRETDGRKESRGAFRFPKTSFDETTRDEHGRPAAYPVRTMPGQEVMPAFASPGREELARR